MAKTICGVCGKVAIESIVHAGQKVCKNCYNNIKDIDLTNNIKFNVPENVFWIGRVARMGNARAFFIPKGQRPFLKLNQNYIIIVKEAKT